MFWPVTDKLWFSQRAVRDSGRGHGFRAREKPAFTCPSGDFEFIPAHEKDMWSTLTAIVVF